MIGSNRTAAFNQSLRLERKLNARVYKPARRGAARFALLKARYEDETINDDADSRHTCPGCAHVRRGAWEPPA